MHARYLVSFLLVLGLAACSRATSGVWSFTASGGDRLTISGSKDASLVHGGRSAAYRLIAPDTPTGSGFRLQSADGNRSLSFTINAADYICEECPLVGLPDRWTPIQAER